MIMSFKAASALLSYPSIALQEAVPEIRALLAEEQIFPALSLVAFEPLLLSLEQWDIYDLQERYVLQFDQSRTLSLNLFEHVHGESRDRGSAMVNLLETYRAGGMELESTELPDHLPVLLEFLSTRQESEAKEILIEAGHILATLSERLKRRESPYAAILAALAIYAEADSKTESVQELLSIPDDNPRDLDALDAVWEEAEVTFGPDPNAGCPVAKEMLANIAAPVTPSPATNANQ
jgi:nitrate reductase molybdenum cofactor assembly chaperone NarJ/NarW